GDMRAFALAATVAVLSFAAALAQDATPTAVFVPQYEARPGVYGHLYYPPNALQRQISGATILCCSAHEDRSLACRLVYETPRGENFGDAAVRGMQALQLTRESYADYAAHFANTEFQQTQTNVFGGPAPALPPVAERQALCHAH